MPATLESKPLTRPGGSDAASAALSAAVPLLQLAALVTLFEVRDGSRGTPVEDAAAYLSRHSIGSQVVSETGAANRVAATILEQANSGKYAYVTMGAYSQPRILEALFGGVTREMLKQCRIPLLIAH